MRFLVSGLGLIVITGLWLASATFNYSFGYQIGESDFDHQLYAVVAVLFDGLKSLLPFIIGWALLNKRFMIVVTGSLAFVFCVIISTSSAIGYGAKSRQASANTILAKQARVQEWRDELIEKKSALSKMTVTSTPQQIKGQLEAMRHKHRWQSSKQCTNDTAKKSKQFCQKYAQLKSQLPAAQKHQTTEKRIADLRKNISKAGLGKISKSGDVQGDVLGQLLGIAPDKFQTIIVVIVGLLIELASTMGFYWVLHHGGNKKKSTRKKARGKRFKTLFKRPERGRVGQFAIDSVIYAKGGKLGSQSIYEAYKRWCAANNKQPVSPRKFQNTLAQIGKTIGWQLQQQKGQEINWLDLKFKDVA